MGEKRFISASERSVMLLEGALLYGRLQHEPRLHAQRERLTAWRNWQANHSVEEQEAARNLQNAAFNAALSF